MVRGCVCDGGVGDAMYEPRATFVGAGGAVEMNLFTGIFCFVVCCLFVLGLDFRDGMYDVVGVVLLVR